MTLTIFAPAKINLSLRVGPPQHDGRHPLDSLVCFTKSVGDILTFAHSQHLTLTIQGPFGEGLTADEDNLILRAARVLADHCGRDHGGAITLDKRLPIASGIGGGSADAAAALVGLNALWGSNVDDDALTTLGAKLGADVPACILGKSLRMTGTGETIAKVPPLPKLGIVLVNPLIGCPTGPVYHRYDDIGDFSDPKVIPLPDIATPHALLAFLKTAPNDLQAPAIALVPEISDVLAAIDATSNLLLGRMSGSGATCFGLYPDLARAQEAAKTIKNRLASWPIWVEADIIN